MSRRTSAARGLLPPAVPPSVSGIRRPTAPASRRTPDASRRTGRSTRALAHGVRPLAAAFLLGGNGQPGRPRRQPAADSKSSSWQAGLGSTLAHGNRWTRLVCRLPRAGAAAHGETFLFRQKADAAAPCRLVGWKAAALTAPEAGGTHALWPPRTRRSAAAGVLRRRPVEPRRLA
jgi:hypothetical protein